MEDKTLRKTMLFDFFGELLTEKQREYYDLHNNEDLSLSEIAEKDGVTRQSVYDTITRAERTLEHVEEKTGVIKRYIKLRKELENAEELAELLMQQQNDKDSAEIADKLVSVIANLKTSLIADGV